MAMQSKWLRWLWFWFVLAVGVAGIVFVWTRPTPSSHSTPLTISRSWPNPGATPLSFGVPVFQIECEAFRNPYCLATEGWVTQRARVVSFPQDGVVVWRAEEDGQVLWQICSLSGCGETVVK
jgi:hypothetical protein